MKLSIFIKMLLVPVVFFSSLAFVDAQNIGSLKDVVPAGFSFKKDLLPGDTDPDITQLQKVLNADPDTTVSVSGDGSVGKESTYFGEKTKQAVIKFQQKYYESILIPVGLTVGNGNVGKSTRTRLNLLIGEMNTTDSSGRVQNRSAVTNTAPVITTTQTTQTATVSSSVLCNFINLLINIDVISQSNAQRALGVFGCSSNYSYNSSTGGTPSVDLRVNGSNGPLTFSSDRTVTVSWTSENVTSCQSSRGTRETSGSDRVSVEESGTFVISCTGPYGTVSDSVNVRLRNDEDDEDLSAYCYPSLTSAALNQSVVWVVIPSGGPDSDYTYSWSGSDSLSGSGSSVIKSYSTSGSKSASVTVRSDNERETVSCANVSVSTSSSASSTPSNPFTPLSNFYFGTSTSSQGSTSGQASLLINGQTQASVIDGSSYQISYDTAGLSCTASSTQTSSAWIGLLAQRTGSVFESNVNSAAGSSDVSIYGPDGTFIEKGRVNGDEYFWARFSKKGGDYPNGSYVSIKGQAKCVIANTSARLETCVPLTETKKEYSMSCVLPSSTSTVAAFYTSTTTNPSLASIVWPVVKKATVLAQNSSSYYPFSRFLWKPVSEADGHVVVMFGPFPDEEEEALPVQTDFGGTIVGAGNCKPDDGNHYRDFSVEQSDGSKVTVGWWPGQGLPEPVVGQTVIGYALSKGKPKCQDYDPLEGEISGKYIGMAYEMDVSGSGSSSGGKWQCRAGGCYWDPGVEGDNIGPNSQGDAKAYDLDYASKNPNGPGARGQQSGSQNLGSSDFEGGDVFDLKGGAEGAAIGTLILPGIGTVIGGTIGGFGDSISSVFKGF